MDCTDSLLHLKRAKFFIRLGFFDQALQACVDGLRENKDSVDILLMFGKLHQRQGAFREAEECFSQILLIDAQHQEALIHKAMAVLRLEKVDEAIDVLETVVQIEPTASAFVSLGNAYQKKTMWNKAEFAYKKALEQCPDESLIITSLGMVALKQQRYEEARDYFEAATQDFLYSDGRAAAYLPYVNFCIVQKDFRGSEYMAVSAPVGFRSFIGTQMKKISCSYDSSRVLSAFETLMINHPTYQYEPHIYGLQHGWQTGILSSYYFQAVETCVRKCIKTFLKEIRQKNLSFGRNIGLQSIPNIYHLDWFGLSLKIGAHDMPHLSKGWMSGFLCLKGSVTIEGGCPPKEIISSIVVQPVTLEINEGDVVFVSSRIFHKIHAIKESIVALFYLRPIEFD